MKGDTIVLLGVKGLFNWADAQQAARGYQKDTHNTKSFQPPSRLPRQYSRCYSDVNGGAEVDCLGTVLIEKSSFLAPL